MGVSLEKIEGKCIFKIDDGFTIVVAGAVRDELAQGFSSCSEMDVDLSAISDFDSAGFQLLISMQKEAEEQHIPFRFLNPSQAVQTVFKLFHFDEYEEKPIDE